MTLPTTACRLTRAPYADLSGYGAQRYGGRWNSPGRPAVYLSTEAALPVLEVLVHLDLPPELIPGDYVLMAIDLSMLPDEADAVTDRRDLAPATADTRAAGDAWLAAGETPFLRVRSAIVAEASNLLLNPHHPAAHYLPEPTTRPFRFDPRLIDPSAR